MSGMDIRRSARKKRWLFDSLDRIKCSNRAVYEPHPLLNKSSFDSKRSCTTDDTSQQSSQMEERTRWTTSYRSILSTKLKKRNNVVPKSALKRNYQEVLVERGENNSVSARNDSARTFTTYEMQDCSEGTETQAGRPSLIQEATMQLTSARAWLENWEAARLSFSDQESCADASLYSTVQAFSRIKPTRSAASPLQESTAVQAVFKQNKFSECTCSMELLEAARSRFNRRVEESLLQQQTREGEEQQETSCNDDSGSESDDDSSHWYVTPKKDDDSLFQSVIQGAYSLPNNYDEHLGDGDDPSEPPLVLSRTVDEGDCSPLRRLRYTQLPACEVYPWRVRESGHAFVPQNLAALIEERDQYQLASKQHISSSEILEMPHAEWVQRPSTLTLFQRNVSDPLHFAQPAPTYQRRLSDPIYYFNKDVLADETEADREADTLCDTNGHLPQIAEGLPGVFLTGNRFDDISSIGGEDFYQSSSHDADDERLSMNDQDGYCTSPFRNHYRRRQAVVSWFHQNGRSSSSRPIGRNSESSRNKSTPVFIHRSARQMLDEGDWSLDVPRRRSKAECEI
ncbi:hypothetical protein FisN_40Lh023 [Fistulifera solaris]|uniref:Uncharacterized protein n=1 Tax=Fistulifera solaris TaxID=1519565 RepID=A0A1Z5J971_FISSO|nr:hypothetical protein FisN_40Lh023 [Fistulifera solaris]|eukprot:GAX10553.1 hypothetical protein FisN_40Lh023 [Fistulifera solaris]